MIQPSQTIHKTPAITNMKRASSKRPWTSWPRPGTKKLQSAAITFPPDPCPVIFIFYPVLFISVSLSYEDPLFLLGIFLKAARRNLYEKNRVPVVCHGGGCKCRWMSGLRLWISKTAALTENCCVDYDSADSHLDFLLIIGRGMPRIPWQLQPPGVVPLPLIKY